MHVCLNVKIYRAILYISDAFLVVVGTFLTWLSGNFSLETNLICMTLNAEMHPDFTLQNMNIACSNPVGHSCSETFWDVLCIFTLERDYIYIYSTWNIVGEYCWRVMQ